MTIIRKRQSMQRKRHGRFLIIEGTLADIDGVRPGQILHRRRHHHRRRCRTWASHATSSAKSCLIFAGMGDIHIHAREDVTGQETHKETFATAAAAALHGGVVHVADMPNNPAAPIDDASYAAKENLVAGAAFAGRLHALRRHRPGTRPLTRQGALQGVHGPQRRRSVFLQSRGSRPHPGRLCRARRSASIAKIRSCWRSTGDEPTHEEPPARRSAN